MARRGRIPSVCLVVTALIALPNAATAQDGADALTFREVHFSQILDFQLDGPSMAAVSPDGDDLYASANNNGGIAHFVRNENDGTLMFAELTLAQLDGMAQPAFVNEVAVSRNGRFVYTIIFANDTAGIGLFTRDTTTGVLTPTTFFFVGEGLLAGVTGITSIALSSDGDYLYATGRNDTADFESVLAFALDGVTGMIAPIDRDDRLPVGSGPLPIPPFGPLTVSPNGRNLYVAGMTQGGIEVYTIAPDTGEVTFLRFVSVVVDTLGVVQWVAVSPDGRQVFASEAWNGNLIVLERDTETGDLTPPAPARGTTAIIPIPGVTKLACSPDGRRLYTLSFGNFGSGPTQLSAFARDTDTGELSLVEAIQDGIVGFSVMQGNTPIMVSRDSRNVYVPAGSSDSLVVFSVERPELPCEDFPAITMEYDALAAAYDLYEDVDLDGLPEFASIALLEEASCANADDGFDEALTNAYLINRAGSSSELEVYDSGEWIPYQRALATLRLISETMGMYLNDAFAEFGLEMHDYYAVVSCVDGSCEPANARDIAPRNPSEPLSGEGDPDEDGFTNVEEWANVLARGGSVREFAVSALDPSNDGTRVVTFGGGDDDGCFIATAAYGTPLAAELDTLRKFRDDRLLTNPAGAAFTEAYYRLSPPAAGLIAEHSRLRAIVRALLAPIIEAAR